MANLQIQSSLSFLFAPRHLGRFALYSQASCIREVVAQELEARSNLFTRGRVTVVGQTTRVN